MVLCTIIGTFCSARIRSQFFVIFAFYFVYLFSRIIRILVDGRCWHAKSIHVEIYIIIYISYLYHIRVKVGRVEGPLRAPDKRVRTRTWCKLTLAVEFNVKAVGNLPPPHRPDRQRSVYYISCHGSIYTRILLLRRACPTMCGVCCVYSNII